MKGLQRITSAACLLLAAMSLMAANLAGQAKPLPTEGATLRQLPEPTVREGTFTAVALNVDGLPNKIATISLNPDGPGADGTKLISRYLASKDYDIIGCSEDFNYNGSLMESLNDRYSCGTIRATLSVGDLPWSQILQGKFRFDTDGLNLIWKNSAVGVANESWTGWETMEETDGNQYVRKGFRHYDVTLEEGIVIDLYILHMDAGDTNATWSREAQWRQLADAINATDHTRAKLVIGDTNSRWTRENITQNFKSRLASDMTMSDVWVELCRGGVYPNTSMGDLTDRSVPTDYSRYEIVDKIIYINPRAAYTVQLKPQTFRIEQDYTYGTVEGTDNTTPLGDHNPVVVNFKYSLTSPVDTMLLTLDEATDNTKALAEADGDIANFVVSRKAWAGDEEWNTMCLPFNLTRKQVRELLPGAALMELDVRGDHGGHKSGLEGTTLYVFFKKVTKIAAGRPFLIQWPDGNRPEQLEFHGMTIAASADDVVTQDNMLAMRGCYSPLVASADGAKRYRLTADGELQRLAAGSVVAASQAYFQVGPAANVEKIVVGFGNEADGIIAPGATLRKAGTYYSIDGRQWNGKPMRHGVYIVNGRKVVIGSR